jgi:hypothetical protein
MFAVHVLQYIGQQFLWQLPLPGLAPAIVAVAVVAIVIVVWVIIWVPIAAAGVVQLLCGVPLQFTQDIPQLALLSSSNKGM